MKKKIIIIGAGPGGLTAGMILSHRGFDVTILEKAPEVGGRNAAIKLGNFTFDTGPTFLLMNFVLSDIFSEVGRRPEEYMEFKRLEPMYRLKFPDFEIFPTSIYEDMKTEVK
ncbi:MAG: NAD(P)-binding protein, partial [bacterium]|nr:NAD(P)-binding protein [bacterium]